MKDRKKEFVEGNKTVCQDDCGFSNYDHDNQKANCSCNAKGASSSITDMNINISKLYEKFEDTNNKLGSSNLGVTSCNILSSKENIQSNTGFFLLLLILILFIIIFIIFCSRGYNSLENKMDEIIYKKFKNQSKNKKNNNILNSLSSNIRRLSKPNKKSKTSKAKKKPKENHITQKLEKNPNPNSKKILINNRHNNKIKTRGNTQVLENRNKKSIIRESSEMKPDTDYELNWLLYKDALKHDKRSNCDYYGSLIRSKQLFIFTFCSFNDYNSGVIKKFMFFLSFALHYTVNALFFTENTMHQIYEDGGKFNFSYQVSKILYSAIISTVVLRLMLQFLVLTDKDVLQVKLQNSKIEAVNKKNERLKCMKIKFAIFFILNFILLGLFWYYLTCFNAIYKNTQIYLIENTFISFAFSLFYPFIINILPTMIRMNSIHSSNKDQEYCYKVSQIIQII